MDKLEAMRYAGRINREAIEFGFKSAIPGTSLKELDKAVESYILLHKCQPVFKGYRGFPATCCLSPNEVVVHGIPSNYILINGDLLTIDVGCSYEGWMVDSAKTSIVGGQIQRIYTEKCRLIDATEAILKAELNVIKDNCSLLEIALAAETEAKRFNAKIFPQWGGHSIGATLHEEPFIPNCIDYSLSDLKQWKMRREYDAYKLKAGQTICLEPVVTFGNIDTIIDEDGWTIRTKDGSLVAHTEHCLLITETGYEILS